MTKETIKQFIETSAFHPRITKIEIRHLPEVLIAEEILHGLLEGHLQDFFEKSIKKYCLIVATDRRILFLRKSFLGKGFIESVELTDMISIVEYFSSPHLMSNVILTLSNALLVIEHCRSREAREFQEAVNRLLSQRI